LEVATYETRVATVKGQNVRCTVAQHWVRVRCQMSDGIFDMRNVWNRHTTSIAPRSVRNVPICQRVAHLIPIHVSRSLQSATEGHLFLLWPATHLL